MVVRTSSGKSWGSGGGLTTWRTKRNPLPLLLEAARNIGAFRLNTNLVSNTGSQLISCVTLEKSPGISLSFKTHLQNGDATPACGVCVRIKQGSDCEESATASGTQPVLSKQQLSGMCSGKDLRPSGPTDEEKKTQQGHRLGRMMECRALVEAT